MDEKITFENQAGEKLVGTLARPDGSPELGVALGHCFTCSRHIRVLIDLAEGLASAGFLALRFDFSGNGQSEGDFARSTYSKHIGEMKAAAGLLRREGAARIGFCGHSMGAAISLLTASELGDAVGVVTLAGRYGGINPRELLSQTQQAELAQNGRVAFESRNRSLELEEGFFKDAESHDIAAAVADLAAPVLAVHGDQDRIVPVEEARRGRELNPQVHPLIVEGADHMFLQEDHRRRIVEHATDWFRQRLSEQNRG
jgi:putative redox protein